MADRVNQTTAAASVRPTLALPAVPAGAAAIQWTVACANQALLRCLPERFRTQATSSRFITPARIIPVPEQEMIAHEHADKPAIRITTFGLLLAAGLSAAQASERMYTVEADTLAYANIFLEQPTLFVDEQLERLFFSADVQERQQASCLLGHAVLVVNLAAAPRPRLLPHQPWHAVLHQSLQRDFLPAIRQQLQETPAFDEHRFAALADQILALLPGEAAPPSEDQALREQINALVNSLLGDDQPVDAVDWEPETTSRFVAHGAKVLFLRPGQELPVFEYGTGVQLDTATQRVVLRQVLLEFYERLQERWYLPVVAAQQQELRQQPDSIPLVYHEFGLAPRSIVEHYLQSDLPAWYLEQRERPWRRKGAPTTEFALYPP